jgi:hypothetical protein
MGLHHIFVQHLSVPSRESYIKAPNLRIWQACDVLD